MSFYEYTNHILEKVFSGFTESTAYPSNLCSDENTHLLKAKVYRIIRKMFRVNEQSHDYLKSTPPRLPSLRNCQEPHHNYR